MNEWMEKMWQAHPRDYYSSSPRGRPALGDHGMSREDDMLSGTSHHRKTHALWFHLHEVSKAANSLGRSSWCSPGAGEREKWEDTFQMVQVSVKQDALVLRGPQYKAVFIMNIVLLCYKNC